MTAIRINSYCFQIEQKLSKAIFHVNVPSVSPVGVVNMIHVHFHPALMVVDVFLMEKISLVFVSLDFQGMNVNLTLVLLKMFAKIKAPVTWLKLTTKLFQNALAKQDSTGSFVKKRLVLKNHVKMREDVRLMKISMFNAIVMKDFRENFAKLILVQIRHVRTMVNVWSTGKIIIKKLINSLTRDNFFRA